MRRITAAGIQTNTQNLRATWPTCLLGDLEAQAKLVIKNGFSCGTHTTVGDGIPHLRPFNVTDDGRLSFAEVKRIPPQSSAETYGLLAGDILYNNTNSEELVGKCSYWPGRDGLHLLSNHMTILRVASCPDIEARFLGFYLLWFWVTGSARLICRRHVNQASIGLERMRQIEVPCPPIQEQQAIAYILSRVQAAVEVQENIVATLREQKAATMAKLFREGLRGEPLKQTEVGEIPESWDVVTLGELAKIERGKFAHRPRNEPRFYGGAVPFIQTGDVAKANGRIRRYSQTLNEAGIAISRLFPRGTIVLTIAANIADTGILEFDSAFPDSLVGITPDPTMDSVFLESFLRTQKAEMDRLAPKGTQKNINIQFLKPWPVPRPPLPEQREVARSFRCIDDKLDNALQRQGNLKALFATMLHRLVTGQARVPPRWVARLAARFRAQKPRPAGKPVDEAVVQEIVRRIVEAVAPEKIILFGSAARGEMGCDSDLDFLVVKRCEDPLEVAREVYRRLRGVGAAKDIVVVTPEDMERDRDTIGYIIRPALREGRVVYAA